MSVKIRQLFCCHAACESYSYWYVCQVAVITENSLSIWSNLHLPAVCLALQSVLLPTVLCVCLVTLIVADSCLSLHSIHVESKRDSKVSVCKVLEWEDIMWKEQPRGITVKVVPWITKGPFVSSNCNISAVCNLQCTKRTVLQHSILAHLKYTIILIIVWYPDDSCTSDRNIWWIVIYNNTYVTDVHLLFDYKPIT